VVTWADPVLVTPRPLWSGGCVDCTATYLADVERYLMCGYYGGPSIGGWLDSYFEERHAAGHEADE
jgi:hypothetical protein